MRKFRGFRLNATSRVRLAFFISLFLGRDQANLSLAASFVKYIEEHL